MKKLFVVVIAVGALVWAKKRFVDAPAPPVKSETEVAAEKVGGAVSRARAATMFSSLLHREDKETPEAKAKARVTAVLATWQEGGTTLNDAAQAAACLWSRNVRFIPNTQEINDAATGFDHWRHEKNLYTDVKSYSVGEVVARDTNPGRGDYSVVEVLINGQPHRIGVPDKSNPLFWAQ